MSTTTRYIIRGGVEGKKRLEVLSRVMWPTTSGLLARAGMKPGMCLLDLGCGGGDVTLQLASLVGAQGRVVGVDMDGTKLELAAKTAAERGPHAGQPPPRIPALGPPALGSDTHLTPIRPRRRSCGAAFAGSWQELRR